MVKTIALLRLPCTFFVIPLQAKCVDKWQIHLYNVAKICQSVTNFCLNHLKIGRIEWAEKCLGHLCKKACHLFFISLQVFTSSLIKGPLIKP